MRNTIPTLMIVVLVALLIAAPNARSQTNIPMLGTTYGVGVRAIGMGGAFVGLANDYSASYWNPAGLGQLRRSELTGSFSMLSYQNETLNYDVYRSTSQNFSKFNMFGFAFPVPTVKGSLVFSLGYNQIADFSSIFMLAPIFVDTPGDSIDRSFTEIQKGGLRQWNFAGSVQMSERLYVGASINFWTGSHDYSYEKYEEDVLDLYYESAWLYSDRIDTRISGMNMTFSTLYNLYDFFRFGVKVETPVTFRGREEWSVDSLVAGDGSDYFEPMNDIDEGTYEYKIRKPMTFDVGASISLPLITLSGDLQFVDWTQLEYTQPRELEAENRTFLHNLQATTSYRLGAELTLPLVGTRFRAGYRFEPTPYIDSRYSDRKYLSAGVGLLLDRQFMIDAAVVYGWWKHEEPGNYSEDIQTTNYFVSASFRF